MAQSLTPSLMGGSPFQKGAHSVFQGSAIGAGHLEPGFRVALLPVLLWSRETFSFLRFLRNFLNDLLRSTFMSKALSPAITSSLSAVPAVSLWSADRPAPA